jgi:hypothetical protein
MVTITGQIETAGGAPIARFIHFRSLSTPQAVGVLVITKTTLTIRSDPSDGTFSVDLEPGNYHVTIDTSPDPTEFDIAVAEDLVTADIGDLVTTSLPTIPSNPPYTLWNGVRHGNFWFDPLPNPAAPTVTPVTISAGIGHQTGESATYKIAWITSDSRSTLPSSPVTSVVVGPNNATRVNLTPSASSEVTSVHVYRQATDGLFYLHSTVGAATTVVTDGLSQAMFDSIAATYGPNPPFPYQPVDYNSTAGVIYGSQAGNPLLQVTDAGCRITNGLRLDGGLRITTGAATGLVWTCDDSTGVGSWQASGSVSDVKQSVRVATTAAVAHSGLLTVDGVTLTTGDRVLDKDHGTGSLRGIWTAASGAWSRAADADTSAEMTTGMYCFVEEGSVNAGRGYILTTPNPIILGTTPLTFAQFNVNSGGTVTSLAMTVPSWLTVAGSPVTTTGTLAVTAAGGQTQNMVLATPNGSSGALSVRALVSTDIPSLDASKITSGALAVAVGGTGATSARAVGANVGVAMVSVVGGNNSTTDLNNWTPAFQGQIAVSYYGNKSPNIAMAGSTTTGDWKYAFNFPSGIGNVGDRLNSGAGVNSSFWELNGTQAGYSFGGDSIFIVRNWSLATNNSGTGIGVAVMGSTIDSYPLVTLTRVGTLATATITNTLTEWRDGDLVTVSGATPSGFNGTWSTFNHQYNGISGDWSFNYTLSVDPGSNATGSLTASVARARVIDNVGCALNHVPANRVSAIIPGNAMLVFNYNPTHLKGFAICSPGSSGFDSDNYSYIYCDFGNHVFLIPRWHPHTTQPTDATWTNLLRADPLNETFDVGSRDSYTLASLTHSGVTATGTVTVGHLWATGDKVTVSGAVQAPYNGTWTITGTGGGGTTFTYTMLSDPGANATGTVTASAAHAVGSFSGRLFTFGDGNTGWLTVNVGGNSVSVDKSDNAGESWWARVKLNTNSTAASPGITVGVLGGGHGVYCKSDGTSIGISNAGTEAFVFQSSGNGSTSYGILSHTPLWNAAGTTFTGHLCNVTNTASAAGSLVFDWQVGGATLLKLAKAGLLTSTVAGIGSTATDGVFLTNTTAAGAGAQQYSPATHWGGFGWKTNSTAASQAVDFRAYVVPVQGAAAPTGKWTLESSVAGGAYGSALTMDTAGNLVVTALVTAKTYVGTTATISASDVDWSTATYFYKTLGANTTFTFSNMTEGQTISIYVTNTASNWTLAWPTVVWIPGGAPTLTTGAKTDVFTLSRVNSTTFGTYAQNGS